MADYVNNNILCQAYIHVEPENLTQALHQNFQDALYQFAPKRAQFYLYPGVEVVVEVEEGSLKSRITVLGTLALLLGGVTKYPDFRTGVIQMFGDAERLSNLLVSEGLFEARAKHEAVLRTEARTGVVGQLRCIVADLEAIRKANGKKSEEWMAAKLESVNEDVETLLDNLNSDEDRELVRNGLEEQCGQLPSSPAPMPRKHRDHIAIFEYRAQREVLRTRLKS